MTLQIERVSKQFGDFTAVDDLSFHVPKGEMFGLLGANGAGKTTTFRMILDILKPSAGTITWDGRTVDHRIVGYLPEERGLYPKSPVRDQLVFLASLKGMRQVEAKRAVKTWLERLEIPQYETMRVEQLSKGNQQKIQLVAALLHNPELLILDEPFSGLDPVNVEILKREVLALRDAGTTIVFSSHRMEHVEELCQHIGILKGGRAVVSGDVPTIKTRYEEPILFIETDRPDLLQTLPVVRAVESHKDGHFVRLDSFDDSDAVLGALVANGAAIKTFMRQPVSLNDIFIKEVGQHVS
ncbi:MULTISPECIES: ABC transporter ATP-binding protein [Exiguobacterium]|uniref:ABC transporter ATP-binding protein n=1 Tax=Exiguobacterium TaxID=33986 RepID=UPI001BED2A39|nr:MULTISPECIES: ABC transporter ATP-binding protein [Exiguobacterium]MCT4775695.1 ABC transporter ATP-binding protein [Exiguobacterium aquaticum]MCT4787753.1 ABC transporter ATP-binding protein [Exiguobacterium mexicanum]